jgi:hypothetical protein
MISKVRRFGSIPKRIRSSALPDSGKFAASLLARGESLEPRIGQVVADNGSVQNLSHI